MKRALILCEGRLKEPGLRALCDDYYRRCARSLAIEERELKDLQALRGAIPERATAVVLDERGKPLSSRELAAELGRLIELPSSGPIVFVIGGADGLDDALRARATLCLSFGRMTFAHRLVRLMLAEQLYRAVSILEGAPYHR